MQARMIQPSTMVLKRFICIIEIGFVSIGLVELAAAGGTVALTTYIYGPNGQEHVGALTDSIINLGESAAEDLTSLFARKPDIRFIDYLQKKYGLSESERRKLHDLITRQGMTEEEIENEAADLARLREEKDREIEKDDEE